MRGALTALSLAPAILAACAGNPDRHTLAELESKQPDLTEVRVENGLDQAMLGYRKYLEEAPKSSLTPEAMRRLADLKLEKEYGILGDGKIAELPAPESIPVTADSDSGATSRPQPAGIADHSESEADFERRAAAEGGIARSREGLELELPGKGSWRRQVRWRRSSSTTRFSRPIRPTDTTIRSSTRNRARTTSWDGPTKRSP